MFDDDNGKGGAVVVVASTVSFSNCIFSSRRRDSLLNARRLWRTSSLYATIRVANPSTPFSNGLRLRQWYVHRNCIVERSIGFHHSFRTCYYAGIWKRKKTVERSARSRSPCLPENCINWCATHVCAKWIRGLYHLLGSGRAVKQRKFDIRIRNIRSHAHTRAFRGELINSTWNLPLRESL